MCSLCGFAHEVLELGEDLLDRVQVWRVWRQEQQSGADAPNGTTHGGSLVAGEIVHDHDIARRECRDEALFDLIKEAVSVDWLIDDTGCVDPVTA
jgi:hypothetical protein